MFRKCTFVTYIVLPLCDFPLHSANGAFWWKEIITKIEFNPLFSDYCFVFLSGAFYRILWKYTPIFYKFPWFLAHIYVCVWCQVVFVSFVAIFYLKCLHSLICFLRQLKKEIIVLYIYHLQCCFIYHSFLSVWFRHQMIIFNLKNL